MSASVSATDRRATFWEVTELQLLDPDPRRFQPRGGQFSALESQQLQVASDVKCACLTPGCHLRLVPHTKLNLRNGILQLAGLSDICPKKERP